MRALPTLLNAFTRRASGNAACSRSSRDAFGPVKYCSTPSTGGASAIGLVVSITPFPSPLAAPASRNASSAALPLTASTRRSPHAATSANVPAAIPGGAEEVRELRRRPAPDPHVLPVRLEAGGKRLPDFARSE